MTPPTATPDAGVRRSLRRTLFVVVAMFGFGFALVPLYDVLCQVTGLNGKTRAAVADAAPMPVDESRTVIVEFVASVNDEAPWEFRPDVARIEVHPGRFYTTHFYARNRSAEPLTGQAVPSVAPGLAATHFHKIECFCFKEQTYEPGKTVKLPVVFFVDPDMAKDWQADDVRGITLSYTYFRVAAPQATARLEDASAVN